MSKLQELNSKRTYTYDPDEAWNTAADIVDAYLELAVEPNTRFTYSNDGIKKIPYTNKQWMALTGKETPPHVGLIWLKPGVFFKDKKGLIHQHLIKHFAGFAWKIVGSMTRNTLLCHKLCGLDIHINAIRDTVHYYLRNHTDCPLNLLDRVSESISFVAMIHIDRYAEYTAEELKPVNKDRTARGAIDTDSRNAIREMLIKRGITSLRTRKQQETLIDAVLEMPNFSHLKKQTKASLILWLRNLGKLKPSHENAENRVNTIKWKQDNKIALTSAERKFKCLHKDLFK